MNYRHLYHAGSFTDVVKHVVLVSLITALQRKETPFCVLDTHAGAGHYDLLSEAARKTKEASGGIQKLLTQENPPPLVKRYLDCVQKINTRLSQSRFASLRYYPGSPLVARPLLRPQDRIIATELHPQEYQALKSTAGFDKQLATHLLDGYQGLKAFLPPKEKRGCVLIDPPYENPDEYKRLLAALALALRRWETGIYAVWYPIKDRHAVDHFHQLLKETLPYPMLVLELSIYPEDVPSHLNGCGMLIINPPWKLDQEMQATLPWLWKTLTVNHHGGTRVYFLKEENSLR